MKSTLVIGVVSAVVAGGSCAGGAIAGLTSQVAQSEAGQSERKPDGNLYARARLVSSTDKVSPGGEVLIGLTFTIDDTWHLYWRGQNDSGMPINLKLTLPEGYTAGETIWPAPERYALPGEILDYVYFKQVTLVVPVRASQDAKLPLVAKADVEFLVCQEACIPGSIKLEVTVPLTKAGEAPRYTPEATIFEQAQKRWGIKPASAGELDVKWEGEGLVLFGRLTEKMTFMPEEGAATLIDPLKSGEKNGDASGTRMVLRFKPEPGENGARARGFLKRDSGWRGVDYIWIDEPLPKKGS